MLFILIKTHRYSIGGKIYSFWKYHPSSKQITFPSKNNIVYVIAVEETDRSCPCLVYVFWYDIAIDNPRIECKTWNLLIFSVVGFHDIEISKSTSNQNIKKNQRLNFFGPSISQEIIFVIYILKGGGGGFSLPILDKFRSERALEIQNGKGKVTFSIYPFLHLLFQ